MLSVSHGIQRRAWKYFSIHLPANNRDIGDMMHLAQSSWQEDHPGESMYDDSLEVIADGDTGEPDNRLIVRYEIPHEQG